jgi:curli biogenesis system outer membrane secretion channel CsgG
MIKKEKRLHFITAASFIVFIALALACASDTPQRASSPSSGTTTRQAASVTDTTPVIGREQLNNARAAVKTLDSDLAPKAKSQARVSFFPLTVKGMRNEDGNLLFDAMSIELVNTGNYYVIEKQFLDQLLAEHDFQMSGAVGYKTLGQLLEADIVIFGTAGKSNVEIVAVDVNKFSLLASAKNNL